MKNKIFHNITICCWEKHFPSHLMKPRLKTWQKLVFLRIIYSVTEKIRPYALGLRNIVYRT